MNIENRHNTSRDIRHFTPLNDSHVSANHYKMLSDSEEKHLVMKWKKFGDKKALDALIESHMRLVPQIARKFSGYGINRNDLVSEGYIGLMQSVEGFKPEKGFRFSTYARWWIRAAILNFILQTWSLIKIGNSANKKKLFFNLKRAKQKMAMDKSRYLSDCDAELLAHQFNVPTRDVLAMDQRQSANDPSLNQPIGSDDENTLTLMDTIRDTSLSPEETCANKEHETLKRKSLRRALNHLTSREKDIISKRYLTDSPKTLSALARVYGVTAERVRQIETEAINKLKRTLSISHVDLISQSI
jgi:RNA polymerase sigma-32 factor